MNAIRKAAVAGRFYPGGKSELQATVKACMARARPSEGPAPKAIIAPHAGYVYSGDVAASAYARVAPAAETIERVVLLGPGHRVAVRGLAASGARAFETPLGLATIDAQARAEALTLPGVRVFDAAHAQEHSLEVHLPFLQVLLKDDFALLPLVVGDAEPDDVAAVLDRLWGGSETLIVVSSDLSHYRSHAAAREIDGKTRAAIEALDGDAIGRDGACGRSLLGGLLTLARKRGLAVQTVDIRNSGDTAGSKDRVVGYGAWVFTESDAESKEMEASSAPLVATGDFRADTRALLKKHGDLIVETAAASIARGLAAGKPALVDMDRAPAELKAPGACFVTLRKDGRLRGCIGSPESHRPLIVDVAENAYRAAFGDHRFPKLAAVEWPDLSMSISILSPRTPMSFSDEQSLIDALVPNEDGLVVSDGGGQALFLPSVWRQLPDPGTFLEHLKAKAGMRKDHWSPSFKADRFIAVDIETGLPPPPPRDRGARVEPSH